MSKIVYGLKNLYYAPVTIGEGGAVSYGTPVALPGAREMSLDAQGSDEPVYADDTKYVILSTNTGYEGSVTVLNIPDSFYTDILGMTQDSTGALVESEDDVKTPFALLGEFMSETTEKKRFVLYNCVASRPTFGGSTKEDTAEAHEFEISITCSAASDTGAVKATLSSAAAGGASAFAGWFSAVYVGQ